MDETIGKRHIDARYLLKLPVLYGFSYVMHALRPLITDKIQVSDKEGVLKNKELTSGPRLWAIKHETIMDPVNIMPLWRQISYLPDLKIAAKEFKGKERILDFLFGSLFFHVYRLSRGEGADEEDRKQMDMKNKKSLEAARARYLNGAHNIIFPEGTTDTDGTVFPIKSGCYNLSFMGDFKIPILPMGITYDFFAGRNNCLTGKKRNLAFINLGKPFVYEKAYDNVKQDIRAHTNRVRDVLIGLNTITVSQLAGEYILKQAIAGNNHINRQQLQKVVSARVDGLRGLEGLTFDEALLENNSCEKRIEMLYNNLGNYFAAEDKISIERVLLEPENIKYEKGHPLRYAGYKKGNPLRFCANRLIQVSEKRPDIEEVLERTRLL